MQAALEIFFILVGLVVSTVGVVPALLTLGLLPMYVHGIYLYKGKLKAFSTRKTKLYSAFSLAISALLSVAILITGMAVGMWGR